MFVLLRKRKIKINSLNDKIEQLLAKLQQQANTANELNLMNNNRFNYLNSVFKSMNEGVIAYNQEGEIILVNPSAQKYIGLGNEVLFNISKKNYLYENIMAQVKMTLETQVYTNQVVKIEETSLKYYQIETKSIINKYNKNDKIGVLTVLKDVSEQTMIEQLRNEFIENVSHEFRTPMTLISGIAESLKIWEDLPKKEKKRALDIIEIETKRLEKLVTELLALANVKNKSTESQTLTKFDVSLLMEEVVKTMNQIGKSKNITLILTIKSRPLIVKANYQLLYQAISNLIDNAIKYSFKDQSVKIIVRKLSNQAQIKVIDQGIGISKNDQQRIFERFYRVVKDRNSKTGGSGIGLSLVKSILDAIDGQVSVESKLNRGSTFTVKLPLERVNYENTIN
jgi:two-component system phosphate regulon sensor histidine kinase PhoR